MTLSTPEVEPTQEKSGAAAAKTAFITAPPSTNTGVIRRILEDEGIVTFSADELALPGLPLAELIREAIGRADVVVAVLEDGSKGNSNVFLELGFALAMKKRTILIAGADTPLPVDASGIPYLRASPTNTDALRYGLTQFISAPHQASRPPAPPVVAETHPLGDRVDDLLARVRAPDGNLTEVELINIVVEAVRRSGVSVVSEQRADLRADLAVWSDDLEPWVPNPLVIEVKARITTKGDAASLFHTLYTMLPAARATWALLIYLEARRELLSTLARGPVLAMSVEAFLESLRDTSFGELVRGLRNARVHGG